MSSEPNDNPFRLLPSVDDVLSTARVRNLAGTVGHELLRVFTNQTLSAWREEIQSGALDAEGLAERLRSEAHLIAIEERARGELQSGIRRAINATGVVLHTGLGRAPVHPQVARAMALAAGSYCVLEVDAKTGRRNRRDDRLSELLTRLTGAEAAIAVNNNAAAVFLILQTLAGGREAIVSRGELVEIGGSFRIPDVMTRAGVRLVEAGTTNRTRLADYANATGPDTALYMKVHWSNFQIVGFTEEVSPEELAGLGRERGIATAFDLGSGLIETDSAAPLSALHDETLVRDAVASGLDLVCFSGDKLLGGPQAGIVVGRKDRIEALRANPMYRALRLDKVTLAGLEATLALLAQGRGDELPTRVMLRDRRERLQEVARALAEELRTVGGLGVEVVEGESEPGSGSAPGVALPTALLRVRHEQLSASRLAERLRAADPPVFARVQDDALLVDPRTLLPGDREDLVRAFRELG